MDTPLKNAKKQLVETILLTCVEPNPIAFKPLDEDDLPRMLGAIKKGTAEKGVRFQRPVKRNAFLFGCLAFSGALKEEHLIVGYGYRYGKTTGVERLHHVVGEERNVSIPSHVHNEIRRHYHSETDAEVVVFHNHPRIGSEGEGLYFIKSILDDLPIPSSADRGVLQQYAFSLVGLTRQLLDQGRVLFYLGESRYVKQFNLPQLLPVLEQLDWTRLDTTLRDIR